MFTPQETDGQWFILSLSLRKKKNEEKEWRWERLEI
jgi:hypothetical protein